MHRLMRASSEKGRGERGLGKTSESASYGDDISD